MTFEAAERADTATAGVAADVIKTQEETMNRVVATERIMQITRWMFCISTFAVLVMVVAVVVVELVFMNLAMMNARWRAYLRCR